MIEAEKIRVAFDAACDRFDKSIGKTPRWHVAHETARERFERICLAEPEKVRDPRFDQEGGGVDFAYYLLTTCHLLYAKGGKKRS